MPHVRIPGDVSVYYEFHTASGAHDATKPSLLLIAPSWTNATFLGPYVEAFKRDFSVCCVELRGHGRTRGGVRPTYDYFCGAADLGALRFIAVYALDPALTAQHLRSVHNGAPRDCILRVSICSEKLTFFVCVRNIAGSAQPASLTRFRRRRGSLRSRIETRRPLPAPSTLPLARRRNRPLPAAAEHQGVRGSG